jgi:NAD(P)-dependent dehydrogenase (short-subunit alcohol dehydrogenase family)
VFARILSGMTLSGRAALLTGATRVGAGVATALATRGADIALSYHRSQTQADETAQAVRVLGRRALALPADLTQAEACRDLVDRAAEAFGRLDILVALASVYVRVPFDELSAAAWQDALAVDLSASFHCAKAAVPHMRAAGGGRIVLFADWVAASGRPRYLGYLPYYVAKAGVIALGEALALELAGDGILVNTIAPGPIMPAASVSDAENEAVIRATPLGRWGGAEVVAKAVVSLVESDFITGEVVQVDGGRHLR